MKFLHVLVLLTSGVLLFAVKGEVAAQTRCPPGATPGSVQCQPDNPTDQSAPARKRYSVYATWGAIAVGEKDGVDIFGIAVEKETKAGAKRQAKKDCEARGAVKCKEVLQFNDCAGLFTGADGMGWYWYKQFSKSLVHDYGAQYCKEALGKECIQQEEEVHCTHNRPAKWSDAL